LFGAALPAAALDVEGWTLSDAWENAWSRIYQRFSRPDPDGPLLQQVLRPYRRYGLDIEVAEFPGWMERAWQASPQGVRFWAQSLDEFELANRAQLKTETPTWPGGFLNFNYDRYQTRTEDRELFRFSLGQRAAPDHGPEAALTLFSGFVKDDLDVEFTFRWRAPGLGTAGLRLALLDPFINSSFALAESRGAVLPEHINQRGLPLALAVEIASAEFLGLRAEVYGGRIIPQEQDRRFPDNPAADHTRRLEGWLGAVLLEYRLPGVPVRLGAAALLQEARMDWLYQDAAATNRQVEETSRTLRA
jgi:hypothetical protein